MINLIFYLSGELEEVATKEVENFVKYVLNGKVIDRDRQILICKVSNIHSLERLALIHEVSLHLFSGDFDNLDCLFDLLERIEIPNDKMCVRVKNIGGKRVKSQELEKNLGAILWRRGARISVSNPDKILRVYVSERFHLGWLLYKTNKKQFLERRPDLKPFFRPGAILPRLARGLVNITAIKDGTILDPMCGTGTIIIEAGLIGLDFIGIEIFEKIAKGCKMNLKHYNLPTNVIIGDAREMPLKDESVDAIVTDFPYLRSSKTFGEIEELYTKSFEEFSRVLSKDGRVVFISNIDVEELFSPLFKMESKFYQKVHKSLVRRIYVCKKRRK